MSPRAWHDGERKKALIHRYLSRQHDDELLFLYQWIAHLEAEIKAIEHKLLMDSVLPKPRPRHPSG